MRSDFSSTDKVVVAGKAGKNDDPHHGHLDIGHFVVYWNKEYYIRDLGKVVMTKNTLIKPVLIILRHPVKDITQY